MGKVIVLVNHELKDLTPEQRADLDAKFGLANADVEWGSMLNPEIFATHLVQTNPDAVVLYPGVLPRSSLLNKGRFVAWDNVRKCYRWLVRLEPLFEDIRTRPGTPQPAQPATAGASSLPGHMNPSGI